jgi:hypothetical protein
MSPQIYGIKNEYVIDIPKNERIDNPIIKKIINQITSDLYEQN